MITNERQYRITRNWLERFEASLCGVDERAGTLDPRARQALRDQCESQIEDCAPILTPHALRRGKVKVLELIAY